MTKVYSTVQSTVIALADDADTCRGFAPFIDNRTEGPALF